MEEELGFDGWQDFNEYWRHEGLPSGRCLSETGKGRVLAGTGPFWLALRGSGAEGSQETPTGTSHRHQGSDWKIRMS